MRGPKWLNGVDNPDCLLQCGSPGKFKPRGAVGKTFDCWFGMKQFVETPWLEFYEIGVSTWYPVPRVKVRLFRTCH